MIFYVRVIGGKRDMVDSIRLPAAGWPVDFFRTFVASNLFRLTSRSEKKELPTSPLTCRRWKKSSAKRMTVSDSETAPAERARWLQEAEVQARQAQEALERDLQNMRTGRAHPSLLDLVTVTLPDGSRVALRRIAQVSLKDPRTLQVLVHDASWLAPCDKAIRSAGLGLNPVTGTSDKDHALYVPVPAPSQETRQHMARLASQRTEETRKTIRLVRRNLLERIKAQVAREDDRFAMKEEVEELIARWIKSVDQVLQAKVRELGQR
jgi:ribosome recycling factor